MTAEEYLFELFDKHKTLKQSVQKEIKESLLGFAKLKVIEALKAVDLNAEVEIIDYDELSNDPIYGVNSKSILNSYDLNDIK